MSFIYIYIYYIPPTSKTKVVPLPTTYTVQPDYRKRMHISEEVEWMIGLVHSYHCVIITSPDHPVNQPVFSVQTHSRRRGRVRTRFLTFHCSYCFPAPARGQKPTHTDWLSIAGKEENNAFNLHSYLSHGLACLCLLAIQGFTINPQASNHLSVNRLRNNTQNGPMPVNCD